MEAAALTIRDGRQATGDNCMHTEFSARHMNLDIVARRPSHLSQT
jgi:hypothetical protein